MVWIRIHGKIPIGYFFWIRGSRFNSGPALTLSLGLARDPARYLKCFVYIRYIWVFQICFLYYEYFFKLSFGFGFRYSFRFWIKFQIQKWILGIRVKFRVCFWFLRQISGKYWRGGVRLVFEYFRVFGVFIYIFRGS